MRWWLPRSGQGVITQRGGPHYTDSSYQVKPKPFCVTKPSIECPSHSNFGGPPNEALTSDTLPRLLNPSASTVRNPRKRQINRWTFPLIVPDTTILLSHSSKLSCHNVNITQQTISDINNCLRYQALIARPSYAVAKLLNQCHALLIMQQIVPSPCYTKPFRINPSNQDNLSASISTRKKKGYIRLIMNLQMNEKRISLTAKSTTSTIFMTNFRSTSWE